MEKQQLIVSNETEQKSQQAKKGLKAKAKQKKLQRQQTAGKIEAKEDKLYQLLESASKRFPQPDWKRLKEKLQKIIDLDGGRESMQTRVEKTPLPSTDQVEDDEDDEDVDEDEDSLNESFYKLCFGSFDSDDEDDNCSSFWETYGAEYDDDWDGDINSGFDKMTSTEFKKLFGLRD